MSRIQNAFDLRKAFVAFLTCGDPDLESTEQYIEAIAKAGADLIELGIPFSDPTAEGPVIQAANMRALAGCVTAEKIFDMVRRVRPKVKVPMVFMTYANVVFSYGTERFLSTAAEIGVDGIILPDVPYEEREDFAPACEKYGLDFISLIAPTSKERVAMIAKEAAGFLYCVSSPRGRGNCSITSDIASMMELVRSATKLPAAISFDMATPEQAESMARYGDGIIVGSTIVKLIAEHGREAEPYLSAYVRSMKEAVSRA
ncbi:MAG: tryptophan synthase subunit alpha [Hydrogeniiclostridium sp.]